MTAVVRFVPTFVAFLVILLAGWIVARVLRAVARRMLTRVRFAKAVERGGLTRVPYDPADLLARLVYYAVLLFTLQLAFGVWGPNPVSALLAGVVAWLPKAAVAIVVVVVAAAIGGALRSLVGNALGGLPYGRLLAASARWFVVGLGVVAALNQVGVATSVTTPVLVAALATVAGILVVGVGGGLVRPMQARWESWLAKIEVDVPKVRPPATAPVEARPNLEDDPTMIIPARVPPPRLDDAAEQTQPVKVDRP